MRTIARANRRRSEISAEKECFFTVTQQPHFAQRNRDLYAIEKNIYSEHFHRFNWVNLIENQWVPSDSGGSQVGLAKSSLASNRTFAAKTNLFHNISTATFRTTNQRLGRDWENFSEHFCNFFSNFCFWLDLIFDLREFTVHATAIFLIGAGSGWWTGLWLIKWVAD